MIEYVTLSCGCKLSWSTKDWKGYDPWWRFASVYREPGCAVRRHLLDWGRKDAAFSDRGDS